MDIVFVGLGWIIVIEFGVVVGWVFKGVDVLCRKVLI